MTCRPERVTGFVDGVLDEAERAETQAHLDSCAACRRQAEEERAVRERLRSLPPLEPRPALERTLRRRLREDAAPRRWRLLLPLAAGLAAIALWARTSEPLLAWQLARDHAHCFSKERLPAQVLSSDPGRVASWFEERGTPLPALPASAGALELVGGRFCPLLDGRRVAHVYYVGQAGRVSLFVTGPARHGHDYDTLTRRQAVRLTHADGAAIGLVSESREDLAAFERALTTTVARDTGAESALLD